MDTGEAMLWRGSVMHWGVWIVPVISKPLHCAWHDETEGLHGNLRWNDELNGDETAGIPAAAGGSVSCLVPPARVRYSASCFPGINCPKFITNSQSLHLNASRKCSAHYLVLTSLRINLYGLLDRHHAIRSTNPRVQAAACARTVPLSAPAEGGFTESVCVCVDTFKWVLHDHGVSHLTIYVLWIKLLNMC